MLFTTYVRRGGYIEVMNEGTRGKGKGYSHYYLTSSHLISRFLYAGVSVVQCTLRVEILYHLQRALGTCELPGLVGYSSPT